MVKEHKDEALFYRNEKAFMGEKVPLTHEFTKSHSQALAAWESSAWRWNGLRFSIIKKSIVLDLNGLLSELMVLLDGSLSWVASYHEKYFLGRMSQLWPRCQYRGWYGWYSSQLDDLSMVVTVQSDNLVNTVALWHTLAGRRISSFMFTEFHDGVLTGG